MANSEELNAWFCQNLELFDFSSTKLNWTNDFFLPHTDICSELIVDGNKLVGRGTDINGDTALLKSFSECIERLAVAHFKIQTSNGVACHYDEQTATKNSYEELIERHLFLSHFHTGTPFYKINPHNILTFDIANILKKITHEKIELSFYILLDTASLYSILAVSSGFKSTRPWGFLFGMGVATTLQVAMEKALIENLRKLSFYLSSENPIQSISLNTFLTKSTHSFRDHGNLALDLDYAEEIKYLFIDNGFKTNLFYLDSFKTIKYNLSKIKYFENIPLSIIQCISTEVQDLYLGTPADHLNFKVLEEFTHKAKRLLKINLLPHPLD